MRSPFLRGLSGLLAAALLFATREASGATWWRLPVWGAEVRVVALDPFRPGTVFCGTSRGNVYVSRDGGETWEPTGKGTAFSGYYVASLVVDPRVPDRLWASLAGQYRGGLVARSDDAGASWEVLARWEKSIATRALALFPADPPLLALGGDDGVRISSDGGHTWGRTGGEAPGLSQVESLAFDPQNPKILYAGTWRQAFRTQDGGTTWTRIAEGMVLDATIYSWDFDRQDRRDIWVSTCGWVYRSRDGGDHWTRFQTGFTNRRSHAVRRDPTRPGFVYAGTVGGLHRSIDDGRTWTRTSRESLVVTALEIDPRSGRLLVGTEGEGAFYSDDGGSTLLPGSSGLAEGRIVDLVPDPNDPGRVFFFRAYGGEESGVWEARGLSVRRLSRDPLPLAASLAASSDRGGRTTLILSSASGVLVSQDGGIRWSAPEKPPEGAPLALFGAPPPGPILVTTRGVFRPDKGGRKFLPVPGAPLAITSADLLADETGEPFVQVRTPQAVMRWNGVSWSSRRRGVLSGGKFLDQPAVAASYSSLQEVGGSLVWERGGKRVAISSPRPGLTLASAASAPGGRIYLGTTGDGLFLFEP